MNRFKRILAVLLVFCMVCTFLPVTAGAAEVDPGKKGGIYDGEVTTLDVVNYYNATGVSVNGNFEVRGVAVDENGTAWCVLASTQANGDKHGFQTVSIAGKPTVEDPHYKNVIKPKGNAELTIKYPDGATETVIAQSNTFTKGQELYIIEIGTVADVLTSFELFIDSADNGWDILVQNPPVEINVEYDITKLVNGKESEEIERSKDDLANRTLTYTIQVKNTGDYAVYNANVNDIVPGNLSVQSVTAQILAPAGIAEAEPVEIHPAFDLETRKLALDTDITLPVGFVKEYTIVAVMDEDYTSGTFVNTAIIESDTLLPDQDEAPTTVKAYFYVHHIYNDGQKGVGEGEQMRVDTVEFSEELRDGAKFDVTTVNSAGTDYAGMWPETLYGGTFQENWTDVYPFENGENGIGFTPEINEHYYVWEPNEHYLRPANLSVWQPIPPWTGTPEIVRSIAAYPISPVDRVQYQEMGFLKERHSAEGVDNGVYEKVVTRKATNIEGLGDTIATSKNAFRLSGYLGCYKIADLFTFNHTEDRSDDLTFLPYWVTLDGVQVTGMVKRTAHWEGEGNYVSGGFDYRGLHIADRDGQYSLSSVAPVSNTPMMISAMFRDDNLTIPEGPVEPDPMTVGVEFETVTAGKSGNVKALELTADLSEFDYDDAWFEVNGEWIETEDLDGGIFAEFSLKGLKKETQLTIVPCWQSGDETFYGAELVLEVVKKTVTVAEEPAEELSEETAEEFVEEYAEEFVEETEEESVEESGKKNDKKSDKKSKKKNDKKSNEEFAEEFVEEIMTVAVISRGQPVAKASVTVDEGTLGMILQ